MNTGSELFFYLLIFMFLLGVTQVLWAIIHAIVTPYPQVRKHFGFYGVGVIVYFFVLWLLSEVADVSKESPLFLLHFVGTAFALAIYHIVIIAMGKRLP